ncbi:uncharacterized protein PHACADRAFT_262274 [Phanerochaete carnosa HHB-10118-sp]|uniref:Dipeptidyl-peptidase V n=1 Tax=Phanerochaete carnosa (strain HHB-10118-sp) TaxID=650164 RepID=K5VZ57_PHACS|nr:uncharacterized protein PHACADRAFT_262274 [Phanerochaete carnosa HHB-10118-sp]EKM51879.1 hypothetical protein PHACADRAFT_262274 [Phanerochaete carnosa HHB-10118-sp]
MWFSGLGLPVSLLGLVAQVPLEPRPASPAADMVASYGIKDFNFKEGAELFSPIDLVKLARPGTATANSAGDLCIVSLSKYSLDDKKNHKSIFIAPIESSAQPLEVPLANGGDAFWLDTRTIAHAVDEGEGKDKVKALYGLSVKFETESGGATVLSTPESPVLIGKFPTASASNFRFSGKSNFLVFSDNVFPDGDLRTVKKQDEEWENRGDTAFVYDETFERHWDEWVGPKRSTLFSVTLSKGKDGKWALGEKFVNLLNGTKHHAPVEPFGGTDDFDVSSTHVVYTTKDAELPPAWHTKQNVYIVDIEGKSKPRELTSGKQGATHGPVFSQQGDKAAWTELDLDGYESDRAKVVIYDLKKDVRYTLTQKWDRSAAELAFSPEGKVLYLTAGDLARVKVFAITLPDTPKESTTHPNLPDDLLPEAITDSGAVSGIQVLSNGRLVFTRSSLTAPNDVFVLRNLKEDLVGEFKKDIKVEQLTKFTADALKGKTLNAGEDFYFDGVEHKIHGWIVKPPGFKAGEKKKYPIILLIHGGPQGAWEDQWSTRWNPQVFAQQGYFTVAINPTGSTTFGQELTDAIRENWGSKPFDDLRKGWKYVLDNFPEVDPNKAVAAGASWGGYAINWIQGHPEYDFGFKALFCHDGVFDARYNGYSTDELFFFNHEWGGRPWDSKAQETIKKYNPVEFVSNWSTPMLIVHSSKDYRLPETDGIGAFHALQQLGVPSRLVIFPDENHWVQNHGNSLKWHYEVFRWFEKYIGEH